MDYMDTFTYFGYGSNMLTCKLKDRCPSAVPIGICKIKKHSLKFHKVSHANQNGIPDISGKGDIVPSESETDEVYGVLFKILKTEEKKLDKAEGYPDYGYDKKEIDVISIKGEKYTSVRMYFANDIDPKKKPYHWYKEQVVQGAKEHGLPEDYIKKIKAVESIPDQDQEREKIQSKHLS